MIHSAHFTKYNKLKQIFIFVLLLVPLILSASPSDTLKKALIANAQTIKLEQTVYQGHNDGESCNTEISQPELTLIDEDKDRKEQITFCIKITNTSPVWLSQILLKGIKPELIHTDFLPLEPTPTEQLLPQSSISFYYEHLLEETLISQLEVEATPLYKATVDGKQSRLAPTVKAQTQSKAELIYEPPTVHKTVLPKGGKGMLWQLVLINTSDTQTNTVELSDDIPNNTVFDAMPAGDYISETGIYCQTEGESVTQECRLEPASTQHPRGRIIWRGDIAPDLESSLAEESTNKVTIRFQSYATDAKIGDIISSQAQTYWGQDKNEILSDNPTTPDKADPTLFTVHKAIEQKQVMQIPSLSQWGMIILSLLLLLIVRVHSAR